MTKKYYKPCFPSRKTTLQTLQTILCEFLTQFNMEIHTSFLAKLLHKNLLRTDIYTR